MTNILVPGQKSGCNCITESSKRHNGKEERMTESGILDSLIYILSLGGGGGLRHYDRNQHSPLISWVSILGDRGGNARRLIETGFVSYWDCKAD